MRRSSMGWTLRKLRSDPAYPHASVRSRSRARQISVARLADVGQASTSFSIAHLEDKRKPIVAFDGFRGAGKSTIGKALAKTLRASSLELDAFIQKQANLSLQELFRCTVRLIKSAWQ